MLQDGGLMDNFMWTLDSAGIIKIANQVKEIVLKDLHQRGYMTEDDAKQYLSTRVVSGYRPSWFGVVWNSLRKKTSKNDEFVITMIDAVSSDKED
jgi:hypothetical protein